VYYQQDSILLDDSFRRTSTMADEQILKEDSTGTTTKVITNDESQNIGEQKELENNTIKTTATRTPNFSKKATVSRMLDPRLPVVKSTSVFDRLYKSHTAASKSHALSYHAKLKPSTRAKLPNRRTSGKSANNIEKDLLIFNRMTISRSKRVSTPHKINWGSNSGKMSSYPPCTTSPLNKKRPSHTPPTKYSTTTTPRSSKRVYEFSPRMKPITKLYYDSKFHPGLGLELVDPISLGYKFFQSFCDFETGGIGSETIAKEIFLAFFRKDFPSIRHWKLQEPVLTKNSKNRTDECGGTIAYSIMMDATYSWEDAYRVTHARGVIRFKRKEIRVENFTYVTSGDS